jgi:polyhydroxyalkanoate synthesis repressor PhaR
MLDPLRAASFELATHDASRYAPVVPRVIKRYPNRKLYDVEARAYVSLEEVAGLVRGGETVQVVDHATGDDITAQTLTQVILDEGKRGTSLLPTDLLHGLLRRGGQVVDSGLGAVRQTVDGVVHGSLDRLARVLPVARQDELERLRAQLAQLEQTLGTLLQDRGAPAPDARPSAPRKPAPRKPAARKRGRRGEP